MSTDTQQEHAAIPGADPKITPDEVINGASFEPETDRTVIAFNTHLAVATTRPNGRWAVYHALVNSTDYGAEEKEVLNRGTKMHQADAEKYFPKFKHLQYDW